MAIETKLNLKYEKTTKQRSGTKGSKNGKAKTKNPPRFINTITYHKGLPGLCPW
jgi:hypothetical protein